MTYWYDSNEIAAELGFLQPQNLSNWFKRMEGCIPNEYRETMEKKSICGLPCFR